MLVAIDEANALVGAWRGVVLAYTPPDEMDTYGYPGTRLSDFEHLFESWHTLLGALNTYGRQASEVDFNVSSAVIVKLLRDLRSYVEAVKTNGFQWLFSSTPFLQIVPEIGLSITTPLDRRLNVRKQLLKLEQSRLHAGIQTIEEAASDAVGVRKLLSDISGQSALLNGTLADATAMLSEIDEAAKSASTKQSQIDECADVAKAMEERLTQASTSYDEKLSELAKVQADIELQRDVAASALADSAALLQQSNEKLATALQDINRQGLAGAYAEQAKAVLGERTVWIAGFLASIAWLSFIAWPLRELASSPKGIDWHLLLQVGPLAAPAIWLGWFAARNSGMLSRIQQDYEYKATAAVAFEAHKKVVSEAQDMALASQLLASAVKNFGDNPIRLYPQKQESAHPIEDLVEVVQDDKNFNKIIELIKAVAPTKKP